MATPASSPSPEPNALGLLSVGAAAKLAGMSPSSFYRWRKRNRIRLVCGSNVHIDDIKSAIQRERGLPSPTATKK